MSVMGRVPINHLFLLGLIGTLVALATACGGSVPEAPESNEPVSARVVVKAVTVSSEGDRVESITVLTDDGEELTMPLDDGIDPLIWGPRHLQGHIQIGETLGFKIGIRYVKTRDGTVVIELNE